MDGKTAILPENEKFLWFQPLPTRNVHKETRKEIILITTLYLVVLSVLILTLIILGINLGINELMPQGSVYLFFVFVYSFVVIDGFYKMKSLKLCFSEEEMAHYKEYTALTHQNIIMKNFDGFIARINRVHPQDVRFIRDIRFFFIPIVQALRIQRKKGGYYLEVWINVKSNSPAGVIKSLTVDALGQLLTQLAETRKFHGTIRVKRHLFAKRSERLDVKSLRKTIYTLFPPH